MRRRVAKKILDRAALEFALGGYSRYTVREHLFYRAARRIPGHPMVCLMLALGRLLEGSVSEEVPDAS